MGKKWNYNQTSKVKNKQNKTKQNHKVTITYYHGKCICFHGSFITLYFNLSTL